MKNTLLRFHLLDCQIEFNVLNTGENSEIDTEIVYLIGICTVEVSMWVTPSFLDLIFKLLIVKKSGLSFCKNKAKSLCKSCIALVIRSL